MRHARPPSHGSAAAPADHGCSNEYWPDRYPAEQTELYLLVMDERIPRAEYPAIIEALEKLADGFEHETIDPRVVWGEGHFAWWTQELIALMREVAGRALRRSATVSSRTSRPA